MKKYIRALADYTEYRNDFEINNKLYDKTAREKIANQLRLIIDSVENSIIRSTNFYGYAQSHVIGIFRGYLGDYNTFDYIDPLLSYLKNIHEEAEEEERRQYERDIAAYEASLKN